MKTAPTSEPRQRRRAQRGSSMGFILAVWCIGLVQLLDVSLAFSGSQIVYEVTIVGIEDRNLLATAESLLDSVTLKQGRPPATLGLLRQRVERDVPRLVNLLKSAGYFGAQVTTTIDSKAEPVHVRFQVESGPAYRLKSFEIETGTETREPLPELPGAKELGFAVGEPVRSGALVEGEVKLLSFLRSRGFPLPEITERRVVVDHDDRSVAVTIVVAPGPEARFGPTTIHGLDSVERELVEDKIPWRQGDRYDGDLVAKLQKRLSETGLFSVVQITPAQSLDEGGELPVTVTVTEGKPRTVSAGVGYRTDEGLGTTASWEHRNLFHRAERLTVTATLSDIVKSLETTFRKPTLGREERRLILGLRLAEEFPEAYSSRSVTSTARLEQDIAQGMTVGGGVGFKLSHVGQQGEDEDFASISFPLSFGWDASNDLLNPTRGGRLVVQFAPHQDLITTDLRFFKMYASTTHYLEVTSAPSLVLAGRAAVGTLTGASRFSIPADERFYAGGGGSIRGYPYQTVGPLVDDKPVGGRSVAELSLEARLRVTERFGLVAFLDGGTAFATGLFESGETFRWGTGAGVRYFTPIGPFRLDVGFPLDRRSGVDDSFQFYVSLGQAF